MSSAFLRKLKEANAPTELQSTTDDAQGARVLLVQRRFLQEPLEELGLTLSNDGLVQAVDSSKSCRELLAGYYVISVNDQFTPTRDAFFEEAKKSVNLRVKIMNGSAMEELLTRVVSETKDLDFKELYETTPRYAFLHMEHPLFLRWTNRYQDKITAKRLLMQARELDEERTAAEALLALEQEEEKANEALPPVLLNSDEAVLDGVLDEQMDDAPVLDHMEPTGNQHAAAEPVLQQHNLTSDLFQERDSLRQAVFGEPLADELADIIQGVQPAVLPMLEIGSRPHGFGLLDSDPPSPAEPVVEPVVVRARLPRSYTLRDGRVLTVTVLDRTGPMPNAPSGPPPKIPRPDDGPDLPAPSAVSTPCSFCKSLEHTEHTCSLRKASNAREVEKEGKRLLASRSRELCNDFLHGRCSRGKNCPFLHEKEDNNKGRRDDDKRRKRSRSRSVDSRRNRKRSRSRSEERRRRSRSRGRYDRRDDRDDRRRDDRKHSDRDRRDDRDRRSDRRKDDDKNRRDDRSSRHHHNDSKDRKRDRDSDSGGYFHPKV